MPGSGVRYTLGDVAEDHRQHADDKQTQAPCRQHGLHHATVQLAYDHAFDDGADDADCDRRNNQNRNPDVDAMVDGDGGAVAPHYHELAVRQVDDAHHPEHDGQAQADQGQRCDGIDEVDRNDDR